MFETASTRRGFVAGAMAAAVLAFGGMVSPPSAVGEPNSGNWDIEEFDYCLKQTSKGLGGTDPLDIDAKVQENQQYCCYRSGGVWNGSTCVAPSGNSPGAQQVPGDIETAPVVTLAPPQADPPRVSGDSPVVTQSPKCPFDSREAGCPPPKVR